ncbi:hypothetical protein M436DRAFT_71509 [Aureobasidium namibiae CBS 147.97]|uniref:Transcription factor IIIC subunit 5 HTH domain-containing protein n=1 Tax=Aureobasidium namibiae CBS 147.97 TaxID=1043004 RepID=A0A074WPH4_9PEZI
MTDQRPDPAPNRHQLADWLSVSCDRVVTVEHPSVVRDIDKGLLSLGGEHHIKHLLAPAGQTLSVGLSLRPHDPLVKKLVSKEMPVQNVLLRVTIPKRTGRKRKRGSNDPFEFHRDRNETSEDDTMSIPLTAEQLRSRLIDNADTYTIQPVATIKQTHRFRALPDFQLRAGSQPVMKQIGKSLVNPTLSSIKNFKVDMTPGRPADEELIAPPNFTSFEQSLNYLYKQNPGVTHVTDEKGRVKTVNTQAAKKRQVVSVAHDVKNVPTKPPKGLMAIEKQSEALQQCVKNLLELLETRPAVTRRVACNLVDWGNEALFKEATQYVGYSFKSGPFRDTLVKYGLDPRADPKYRCYQTFSFQLVAKDKVVAAAKKMRDGKNQWIRSDRYKKDEEPSHVFDGKSMTTNGKTWQVCDIKEPVLAGLLATENLRSEFDPVNYGWYLNGTVAKARIIMRDMIGMMLSGQAPDTASYETVSAIPDEVDKTTYPQTYFERSAHPEKVMQLSGEIRNLVKTDIAQRVRDKFRGEGEVYGENTQGGAEDGEVEGDGMEDDGEMEGDLEDFGGETEA